MTFFGLRSRYRSLSFSVPRTAEFQTKFPVMEGQKPIRIRFWPAYTNPYQRLFYGHPSEILTAEAGDAKAALEDCRSILNQQVCFHLHWLNTLFAKADAADNGGRVLQDFLEDIAAVRRAGGKVIWTVHNLLEHDSAAPEVELNFRRQLVQLVDLILVHGSCAAELVQAQLPEARNKILSIPHGNYIGIYPDAATRSVAKQKIDAPETETLFVNLGRMRRYKGTDTLISGMAGLNAAGLSAGLVLAGEASRGERDYIRDLNQRHTWLRADPFYVSNNKIQLYLNAGDFVVLPYARILTSGSAILALSFAKPVIAPAIGGLPDIIEDGVNGFLYDPDTGLDAALRRACHTSPTTRAQMSQNAFRVAAGLSWSEARHTLVEALSHPTTKPSHPSSEP